MLRHPWLPMPVLAVDADRRAAPYARAAVDLVDDDGDSSGDDEAADDDDENGLGLGARLRAHGRLDGGGAGPAGGRRRLRAEPATLLDEVRPAALSR